MAPVAPRTPGATTTAPSGLWWLLPAALLLGGALFLFARRRPLVAVVPTRVPAASPTPLRRSAPVPMPDAGAGDIRVPIFEEALTVETREGQMGTVHVHKEVVTEEVSVPVALTHDTVTIQRTSLDRVVEPGDAPDAFVARDRETMLQGEQAVVRKQVQQVEEVHLHKEDVQVQQQITDTVRKEHVTIEGSAAAPSPPAQS